MLTERDIIFAIWNEFYVGWMEHYEAGPKGPVPTEKAVKVRATPLPSTETFPNKLQIQDRAGNRFVVTVKKVRRTRSWLRRK
jgi:hypothetical protein